MYQLPKVDLLTKHRFKCKKFAILKECLTLRVYTNFIDYGQIEFKSAEQYNAPDIEVIEIELTKTFYKLEEIKVMRH